MSPIEDSGRLGRQSAVNFTNRRLHQLSPTPQLRRRHPRTRSTCTAWLRGRPWRATTSP